MSVGVAQRLYLPTEAERRITGWVDAHQRREAATDRSPACLILFSPVDYSQHGVVRRIASVTTLHGKRSTVAAPRWTV